MRIICVFFCFAGEENSEKIKCALDMIQAQIRAKDGMGSFQVENCIVAVKTSATYRYSPVFFGLPKAVMGTVWENQTFTQKAGLAY